MVPNCGSLTKRFGVPRLVWFSPLKASARNWKFAFSVRLNERAKAMSMVCRPGPKTELRPTLPNVYAAGVANAAGLNHSAALWVPDPKTLFEGVLKLPADLLAGLVGPDGILAQHGSGIGRVAEH